MTIYDVVQLVLPGTLCSYPTGKWLVEHHDNELAALQRAEIFNNHTMVSGIEYSVEEHDEESSSRAAYSHVS